MKKPLKVAAWSGIAVIVMSIVALIGGLSFGLAGMGESVMRYALNLPLSILSGLFAVFFSYGFVVLGRKFGGTLLQVMGWISIVLAVLVLLFGIFGNVLGIVGFAGAQENLEVGDIPFDLSEEELQNLGWLVLGIFLIIWIVVSIVFGAYSILFGVGLLKLKDKVPYALVSVVLNIVAGATYIILIGYLVGIAAYLLQIIMLFQASDTFERQR